MKTNLDSYINHCLLQAKFGDASFFDSPNVHLLRLWQIVDRK